MKNTIERLAFPILIAAVTIFPGCSSSNSDSAPTTSGANETATANEISLEVGALEKIDTWKKTAEANAKLTEEMAATMASIVDKESAEASLERFKKLGSQFAAVNRARDKIGEPTVDDRGTSLRILKDANAKFNTAYSALKKTPELFELVAEALDKAYVGEE